MKIMIFIEGDGYIRNYITTDAFCELGEYQLSYALSDRVSTTEVIAVSGAPFYRLTPEYFGTLAYRFASQLQMYDRSKRNKNFLFRLRRELIQSIYTMLSVPNPLWVNPNRPLRVKIEKLFHRSEVFKKITLLFLGTLKLIKNTLLEIPGLVRYFIIVILVKLRLKTLIIKFLWNMVPLNSSIKHILELERPDLLIIPNSVIGTDSYDFIRASKKLGLSKVLVLIDNWDNLSSKTAFIENPDYLGVWGKQSVGFANHFHEIPFDKIRIIGTPRFGVYDNYLKNMAGGVNTENASPINRPYILFAGCAVSFDEIGALKSVASALQLVRDSFPAGTMIVYRPHPWGDKSRYLELLRQAPIEGVMIDPQILANKDLLESKFQPSLGYYPQLLDKALLVICPLSTMVIEATIMGKQVLALAHEDSVSLFSPNRILANYKHFDGLEKLTNIAIVPNLDMLPVTMIDAYQKSAKASLPEELEFFVLMDQNDNYATRLAMFVKDIESELFSN